MIFQVKIDNIKLFCNFKSCYPVKIYLDEYRMEFPNW